LDQQPDLALVDVVLPGIDGIEVLRHTRKTLPATIVIMMSAYHLVERAVEAMKLVFTCNNKRMVYSVRHVGTDTDLEP
jgi:DNA-binding NtrC family response regulator